MVNHQNGHQQAPRSLPERASAVILRVMTDAASPDKVYRRVIVLEPGPELFKRLNYLVAQRGCDQKAAVEYFIELGLDIEDQRAERAEQHGL